VRDPVIQAFGNAKMRRCRRVHFFSFNFFLFASSVLIPVKLGCRPSLWIIREPWPGERLHRVDQLRALRLDSRRWYYRRETEALWNGVHLARVTEWGVGISRAATARVTSTTIHAPHPTCTVCLLPLQDEMLNHICKSSESKAWPNLGQQHTLEQGTPASTLAFVDSSVARPLPFKGLD
jgi:hypothetical protein